MTNKQFIKDLRVMMARHYSEEISRSVKRALQAKKEKLACKAK